MSMDSQGDDKQDDEVVKVKSDIGVSPEIKKKVSIIAVDKDLVKEGGDEEIKLDLAKRMSSKLNNNHFDEQT